jgi:hypothetical protein
MKHYGYCITLHPTPFKTTLHLDKVFVDEHMNQLYCVGLPAQILCVKPANYRTSAKRLAAFCINLSDSLNLPVSSYKDKGTSAEVVLERDFMHPDTHISFDSLVDFFNDAWLDRNKNEDAHSGPVVNLSKDAYETEAHDYHHESDFGAPTPPHHFGTEPDCIYPSPYDRARYAAEDNEDDEDTITPTSSIRRTSIHRPFGSAFDHHDFGTNSAFSQHEGGMFPNLHGESTFGQSAFGSNIPSWFTRGYSEIDDEDEDDYEDTYVEDIDEDDEYDEDIDTDVEDTDEDVPNDEEDAPVFSDTSTSSLMRTCVSSEENYNHLVNWYKNQLNAMSENSDTYLIYMQQLQQLEAMHDAVLKEKEGN